MKNSNRWIHALMFGAALIMGVSACGGDSDETSDGGATVTVEGAWARTSPSMVSRGAAYMSITTTVDDVLTGVTVDASIAAAAEIHEMVMATESTMSMDSTMETESSMPMDTGEMTMRRIMELAVPADGGARLEPGGFHIMLVDLTKPLISGSTFDLALIFARAGEIVVPVTVADEAP